MTADDFKFQGNGTAVIDRRYKKRHRRPAVDGYRCNLHWSNRSLNGYIDAKEMKSMTPYSFAFTIIRLIAILTLSVGLYQPIGFLLLSLFYRQGEMEFPFRYDNFILTVFPGALLYILAHWLAKATIWKIKE